MTGISGICEPRFAEIRAEFARNFEERGEVGAAVCVFLDGRKIVDLWGGHVDAARTRPWGENTLVCMMSVSKAMTSLCLHLLVERGAIDLDLPVATYWPEFAQADKGTITVDCVVSHLAALVFPDHAPPGSMFDWQTMTAALARQEPAWAPGTRGAYHSSTFGFLVGELVRRCGGKSFAEFFHDEIAARLEADFHFGVGAEFDPRIATLITDPDSQSARAIQHGGDSPLARAWRPLPRQHDLFNAPAWRRAVYPSANGYGNARSAARIFAALLPGQPSRLLQDETVDRIATERWFENCGLTGRRYRFGRGVAMNNAEFHPMGSNDRAFGHAGVGGSFVFADPARRLSFGYSMNRLGSGDRMDARCRSLIAALYGILDI